MARVGSRLPARRPSPVRADHRDGVVATALRRAGDEQARDRPRRAASLECLPREASGSSGTIGRRAATPPASSTIAASMSELVSTISSGAGHSAPSGTSSSARTGGSRRPGRRRTATDRLARPTRCTAHVGGAEQAPGGEHEVARGDVLTHLPHVGVTAPPRARPSRTAATHDVLAPDDGVGARSAVGSPVSTVRYACWVERDRGARPCARATTAIPSIAAAVERPGRSATRRSARR